MRPHAVEVLVCTPGILFLHLAPQNVKVDKRIAHDLYAINFIHCRATGLASWLFNENCQCRRIFEHLKFRGQ